MERSESRSIVRSTVCEVARPDAASVFAVGHTFRLRVLYGFQLVPRRAEPQVVTGSPGFIALYGIVLHDVCSSSESLKAAVRASDSRLNGERATESTATN
jgi:hypothetical protein